MSLIFPSNLNFATSPFMVFTPFYFAPKAVMAKVGRNQKRIDENSIVLPFPTGGLSDSIRGEWQPEVGLAGNLDDVARAKVVTNIKEKTGNLFQHFTKGQFLNDYASLSYSGSDFREFPFFWENLIPTTENEANILDQIFKTFKRNSVPNYASGDQLLNYPRMWVVSVNVPAENGTRELMGINYCVITSLAVNNPNIHRGVFSSGHAVETSLSLTFKELVKYSSHMVD